MPAMNCRFDSDQQLAVERLLSTSSFGRTPFQVVIDRVTKRLSRFRHGVTLEGDHITLTFLSRDEMA